MGTHNLAAQTTLLLVVNGLTAAASIFGLIRYRKNRKAVVAAALGLLVSVVVGFYVFRIPPTSSSAAKDDATWALASLESGTIVQPDDVASLCSVVRATLSPPTRDRCATAYLRMGERYLNQRKFFEARDSLASAETFGADLQTVRNLRSQIPGYYMSPEEAKHTSESPHEKRLAAANDLQQLMTASFLRGWTPQAVAEGSNAETLIITFDVKMEQPMIEALHHGRLAYGRVFVGGVAAFADLHGFKKVIYRDAYGTSWVYP
ncbi:MAG: hypothetical protein QOC81_699 [Thermoanaerobaculia bacterium]|jgi:hypothetical protein|nr:hypothetical protein [Thermoanaerobaculia bacterium]